MYDDWQLSPQREDILIQERDISAAIRNADDADWELNGDLPALEPFDPLADDPE